VNLEDLAADPYPLLARLRERGPACWVPALGAWVVTGYAAAVEVLMDPVSFTVDDPRFTTARVTGPSMLSLDGVAHARHRAPFTHAFRPTGLSERMAGFTRAEAARLTEAIRPAGQAELRTAVAGPLAAAVMAEALGLSGAGVTPLTVLSWYREIVAAVVEQGRAQVQQSPHSAEAWGKLGMVLLVHQFQPQAAICFDQAEKLDPREPRWPYFQALEALLRTDLQAARGKLERAVSLCGDEWDGPRLSLAEVLLGLEDFDEAQRHFSLLIEKNPRHARAHLGLARVAVKRGNLRASLKPHWLSGIGILQIRPICQDMN